MCWAKCPRQRGWVSWQQRPLRPGRQRSEGAWQRQSLACSRGTLSPPQCCPVTGRGRGLCWARASLGTETRGAPGAPPRQTWVPQPCPGEARGRQGPGGPGPAGCWSFRLLRHCPADVSSSVVFGLYLHLEKRNELSCGKIYLGFCLLSTAVSSFESLFLAQDARDSEFPPSVKRAPQKKQGGKLSDSGVYFPYSSGC